MSRILFVFLLLWFPACSDANAQIRPQQHSQLRAALDRDDARTAESLLREMMKASPEAFAKNNYDYLLARLLMRRDANIEANELLQSVVARNSPLAAHALWHQAEIMRGAGNAKEEQRLLQKLIAQHSEFLQRERAVGRLAESYFRGGQYQNVISLLKSSVVTRRDHPAMIGEAQLAARQTEAARASFETAIAGTSLDDTSLRAARGLDRLDAAASTVLSEAEHLRRARIYQFNRAFPEARKHWLAVVTNFSQSPKRVEALFQLGRGYFLEENFAESAKWYERTNKEFPTTPEGEQGFYYVGHCFQYQDDADRAIARYEEFLRRYPRSEYVGYAHLNAIDTLRSAGRDEEALKWATRGMATGDAFTVVTSHFKQALIRLSQENYQAALGDFTALRTRNLGVRGQVATTNTPEVAFMRAYCLEKLGRFDEAISEYLALPELRTGATGYYGWRASERLRMLGANLRAKNLIAARLEKFLAEARAANSQGNAATAKAAANQGLRLTTDETRRGELFQILKASYAKLRGYQAPALSVSAAGRTAPLAGGDVAATGTSHQTIAGELLFLGLFEEAGPELAETPAGRNTIAFYCARGDCAKRAFELGEPLLAALPEDYRLELLPRETAEIFYPMPFRDSLQRHAKSRGVDPRFVLSIARQESSYNPRVKSNAAARGLMQFISDTSDQIAAQLRLRDFEQSDLYNADTAILFGSQYMKNLFAEFGTPQAVAASYNGSEASVRRWLARAKSRDVDRFVTEVLKRETKDYVFKVTGNYLAYQKIYPGN
ncbi:MAG TPA: transglycosylase SLT domain-containing protein [Blastocatellia bacterium]|nr:transglycosylase SLT domain-containing protein [Blastocatellia bacterium]HMX27332.1 transglycosylase SLT domain-containing protein [Blastocatellia bacterium]HMY72767.1 transglycosylase SLT domain-containing protein [Blastocatellia bacterium]HMZ18356.1 transglycosylase SLT domain-containing protein [Blastocatellia bacterium]HNG31717.1 transglycosylase SLT domain-containing protein [Blastocatellia bacterium]